MIDPKHDCSAITRPEISLGEQALFTDCVGLPILLSAIALPDVIWFSTVVGEHDDETRIIATGSRQIPSEVSSSLPRAGAVGKFIGDRHSITEYELTEEVASRFGIHDLVNLEITDFRAERAWLVASHDEHWSVVYPISEVQLHRILRGVLGQIGFAIGREIVPEDGVVEALADLLRSNTTIRLEARGAARAEGIPIEIGVVPPAERWGWLQRARKKLGIWQFVSVGCILTTGSTSSIKLKM